MAQPNEELRRLVKERDWLKFSLTRFKSFYDEEGQTIDVDSLEERLNCTVEFIERFEALQERIEILVKKYINFRQNFEKTYRSNRCVVICVWSTSFSVGSRPELVHTVIYDNISSATSDFLAYFQRRTQ